MREEQARLTKIYERQRIEEEERKKKEEENERKLREEQVRLAKIYERQRIEEERKKKEDEEKARLYIQKEKERQSRWKGKNWADISDDDEDVDEYIQPIQPVQPVGDDEEEDALDRFIQVQRNLKSPIKSPKVKSLSPRKSPKSSTQLPISQPELDFDDIPEVVGRVNAQGKKSLMKSHKAIGKCFSLLK